MHTRLFALPATGFPLLSPASRAAEGWTWQGSTYGFFPGIGGTTAFRVEGGGTATDHAVFRW